MMSDQSEQNTLDPVPQYREEDTIVFPTGIPGFEGSKKFVIVSDPEYNPFHWLQCVDGDDVRFAIINPLMFKEDYNPKISKAELNSLQIEDPNDLAMFVIVTLRNPLSESSANLMGPLFINLKSNVGKQIIIEDNSYSIREKIIKG